MDAVGFKFRSTAESRRVVLAEIPVGHVLNYGGEPYEYRGSSTNGRAKIRPVGGGRQVIVHPCVFKLSVGRWKQESGYSQSPAKCRVFFLLKIKKRAPDIKWALLSRLESKAVTRLLSFLLAPVPAFVALFRCLTGRLRMTDIFSVLSVFCILRTDVSPIGTIPFLPTRV